MRERSAFDPSIVGEWGLCQLNRPSHLPHLALMAAPFQEWTIKLGNLFWKIHHFVIDKDVHSLPSRLAADRMQN